MRVATEVTNIALIEKATHFRVAAPKSIGLGKSLIYYLNLSVSHQHQAADPLASRSHEGPIESLALMQVMKLMKL